MLRSRKQDPLSFLWPALLALLFLQVSPARAQQDKWLLLGQGRTTTASTGTYIPADASKGKVCAIRLVTYGGGLELDEVTVHFGNSQTIRLLAHHTIPANSSSPSIPLPGMRRTLSGIDIVYRPQNPRTGTPTTVNLLGRSTPGAANCSE
jgi:hypothetical protein